MSCGRVGEGLAHRSLGTQEKLTPHPTALEDMGWVTQRQVALFTSACSFSVRRQGPQYCHWQTEFNTGEALGQDAV